jgi:hypothetical protein
MNILSVKSQYLPQFTEVVESSLLTMLMMLIYFKENVTTANVMEILLKAIKENVLRNQFIFLSHNQNPR